MITLSGYLYFYLGFYKPVEIEVINRGPMHLLYKSHIGAYHLIGPVIQEVESWAREHKLACDITFGEYIDDPASVDQDRLRSRGGCLVESAPSLRSPQLPFQFEERAGNSYVVAHFTGSPSIGPFKVYPKVRKYLEMQHLKSSHPVIETYRVHEGQVDTDFLFPLEPNPAPPQ